MKKTTRTLLLRSLFIFCGPSLMAADAFPPFPLKISVNRRHFVDQQGTPFLQAYWCVLGGGCGHAYGSPNWNVPKNWRQVLEQPGGLSLKHLRSLLESRPWWKLLPDVNNIVAVEGRGAFATNDYAATALADDGSFALSYLPSRRTLTIDLTKLSGERVVASWFNPHTGEATRLGEFTDKKRRAFEPPADGDWVLVLDDAARQFTFPKRS